MDVRGRSRCGRQTLVPRTCQGLESMFQGREERARVSSCRAFRSGDQDERCLGLFASEGESRERAEAGRRIDKEGVYIWDGTGVNY